MTLCKLFAKQYAQLLALDARSILLSRPFFLLIRFWRCTWISALSIKGKNMFPSFDVALMVRCHVSWYLPPRTWVWTNALDFPWYLSLFGNWCQSFSQVYISLIISSLYLPVAFIYLIPGSNLIELVGPRIPTCWMPNLGPSDALLIEPSIVTLLTIQYLVINYGKLPALLFLFGF